MKSLYGITEHLVAWLLKCLAKPYQMKVVDDPLPRSLKHRTLYVVQDDGLLEQAAMLCP